MECKLWSCCSGIMVLYGCQWLLCFDAGWSTTGKPTYAECQGLYRVQHLEHSANVLFVECLPKSTRWTTDTRRNKSLPSAGQLALGKATLCRVPASWHSVNTITCIAPTRRRPLRWGLLLFAEWPTVDTRQTLSRAPHTPVPKAVTPLPRTFPFFHDRYRYCLPSAS